MKFYLLLLLVLNVVVPASYAGCKGNISYEDNIIIREDFSINPSQSESYTHQFNDLTCAGANTVSPLNTSDVIVGLYDDTVKLKLKFTWINSSDISLASGKGDFSASYRVDVSPASSGASVNISAGSGNSVYIKDVASLSSATATSRSSAFFALVMCLLSGKAWEPCIANYHNSLAKDGGFYSANFRLTYNRKQTTCKPEDLNIILPDIALSELTVNGKVASKNASENIRLQCDNLFGDRKQTSRKMVTYLSSSDLVAGSSFILRGSADNGVGFVLENNNQLVNISSVTGQGSATTLWKVDKPGDEVNSNTVNIPIVARYYVYDKSKVKPGNLSATALIYVQYD
ncbi:putative fimbrial-like adhesin protein [Citrobacter farmeri]|uniref:putative fimbrial-like adhesin protein n=1 Tax=Citrobacter farmeri TaxID=67824 RepID=UPI0018A9C786|nr:putative fimbrial-like adhesin protein [Citrobacter farmeri]MDB2179316.1 putative fimbrial-like adhesin protein [Citrobacter farmeri]